jgi:hypothetical protein
VCWGCPMTLKYEAWLSRRRAIFPCGVNGILTLFLIQLLLEPKGDGVPVATVGPEGVRGRGPLAVMAGYKGELGGADRNK